MQKKIIVKTQNMIFCHTPQEEQRKENVLFNPILEKQILIFRQIFPIHTQYNYFRVEVYVCWLRIPSNDSPVTIQWNSLICQVFALVCHQGACGNLVSKTVLQSQWCDFFFPFDMSHLTNYKLWPSFPQKIRI